jgi:ketosteroid isomerase-like protein
VSLCGWRKGSTRYGKRVGKEKLAMSEHENTELVQQAYGSFRNGDIPAVLDSLSEDVQWVTAEIKGVPVGGTWRGREQVGQFFQTLSDVQEARQFEPREFIAQDDRVVALGHYAWHVESTGREWESDFAHVFTVRDGKITRFQEYTDTAALGDAFREG